MCLRKVEVVPPKKIVGNAIASGGLKWQYIVIMATFLVFSHKPGCGLLLLSTRAAVTFSAKEITP